MNKINERRIGSASIRDAIASMFVLVNGACIVDASFRGRISFLFFGACETCHRKSPPWSSR